MVVLGNFHLPRLAGSSVGPSPTGKWTAWRVEQLDPVRCVPILIADDAIVGHELGQDEAWDPEIRIDGVGPGPASEGCGVPARSAIP